jgi:hypothetical protein
MMSENVIIRSCNSLDEIDALANVWERLRENETNFFPTFSETKNFLEENSIEFRVLVAELESHIIAIGCFLYGKTSKYFTVGERRLFSLPVRQTTLYGSAVLGTPDSCIIKEFLHRISKEWSFDLITLGEIKVGSPLHKAAMEIGGGLICTRVARKKALRWMINLPNSFDDYLNSLRSTTRSTILRKLRKFERMYDYELKVIERLDQIEGFLRDAEAISRRTYQWNLGQQLRNDEPTRRRYRLLAELGQLRCYILYVNGEPCAFLRGQLSCSLYNYETPGFDPRFEKGSPGIVLLVWSIRDLIEKTDCKVFDFGQGGDDSDYKSKFGNICFEFESLQLTQFYRPYPLLLTLLQEGFSLTKNILSLALGNSIIRRKLKRLVRRYGDADTERIIG